MTDEMLKLFLSLLAGLMLGMEREYKYKSAGIRTIPLISVGSTLFTILSVYIGAPSSPDRIASNILTGVGFIGAGVIFKNDLNVNGLTTAATIWIAAAIGIAIGNGNYLLAFSSVSAALLVLLLLNQLQSVVNGYHQIRIYKLSFQLDKIGNDELEAVFRKFHIRHRKLREFRNASAATSVYQLSGRRQQLDNMNEHLMRFQLIDSFAY
jgi:putative Mg2+ transporter-C (MgtC) family protein